MVTTDKTIKDEAVMRGTHRVVFKPIVFHDLIAAINLELGNIV